MGSRGGCFVVQSYAEVGVPGLIKTFKAEHLRAKHILIYGNQIVRLYRYLLKWAAQTASAFPMQVE